MSTFHENAGDFHYLKRRRETEAGATINDIVSEFFDKDLDYATHSSCCERESAERVASAPSRNKMYYANDKRLT
jgi:hypothetical protein